MNSTTSFVPKLFLAGAFLGAIGCLSRADYNLPIFLFAYIAWNYLRVGFKFKSNHRNNNCMWWFSSLSHFWSTWFGSFWLLKEHGEPPSIRDWLHGRLDCITGWLGLLLSTLFLRWVKWLKFWSQIIWFSIWWKS